MLKTKIKQNNNNKRDPVKYSVILTIGLITIGPFLWFRSVPFITLDIPPFFRPPHPHHPSLSSIIGAGDGDGVSVYIIIIITFNSYSYIIIFNIVLM